MMPRDPYGLSPFGALGASATSLTELFETDALLDALGGRSRAGGGRAIWDAPLDPVWEMEWDEAWDDAAEIRLLRALVMNVDSAIDRDLDDVDPLAVAALAAGFELASAADSDDVEVSGPARRLRDRLRAATMVNRLRVVGGTTGRRLPRRRPYRLVAAFVGVALALGGGSLAAAATTDPTHAWGPLRPLAEVFHPNWQGDLFAAKRDAILRTLDRASQQSKAGQLVAAAVTYGAAKEQARSLPHAPDPALQAKFASVAREIGLGGSAAQGAPVAGPPSSPGGTTSTTTGAGAVPPGSSGSTGSVGSTGSTGSDGSVGPSAGDPGTTDPTAGVPPSGGSVAGSVDGSTGTTTDPTGGATTDTTGTSGTTSAGDGTSDGTITGATPTGGATAGSTPDPAASSAPAVPAPSPQPSDPGPSAGGSTTSGLGDGSTTSTGSGAPTQTKDGTTSSSSSSSTTDTSGSSGSAPGAGPAPASGSTASGSTSSAGSTSSTGSTGSTGPASPAAADPAAPGASAAAAPAGQAGPTA